MSIKVLLKHFIPEINVRLWLDEDSSRYHEFKGFDLFHKLESEHHCDSWYVDEHGILHIYGLYKISEVESNLKAVAL